MNQSTPDMDTPTPAGNPKQNVDPTQYQAQVPRVLYPNLGELTQSQVEIAEMIVEVPTSGIDQVPLIQTSEQTVFQYRLLRLITFSIWAMILGCFLSLNSFFSQLFILENFKHPGQYQVKWSYYIVTGLQFYTISLIPLFRTKQFIIRYQKLICMFQLILQIPFFIGLCRIFAIFNREAIIYILLITSFGIVQYQRYSIIASKPNLSLIVLRYPIYSTVGINLILALLGADMKQVIIIQSLGLYLIYYFIQLSESLTQKVQKQYNQNEIKALWPSIVQYFRSQYPANQQVENNQMIRSLKNIRNILAIFGAISIYVLLYWIFDFYVFGLILWAVLANTQVINGNAKLQQNDYHLASVLVFSDVVNFVPNIVRSIKISV